MENIADALKIIFAVMVFAIACSLLFQTASLARRTSEVLISEEDRTNYYTYMPEDVTLQDLIKKQKIFVVDFLRLMTIQRTY